MENELRYYLEIADNAAVLAKRLNALKAKSLHVFESVFDDEYVEKLESLAEQIYIKASKIVLKDSFETSIWIRQRTSKEFYNCLLVEIENRNYYDLLVSQLFFDTFHYLYLLRSTRCKDEFLADLSAENLLYFNRRMLKIQSRILNKKACPAEIKLKIQESVLNLWKYVPDLFQASTADILMLSKEKGVNLEELRKDWEGNLASLLRQINVVLPTTEPLKLIGKEGQHTKNLSDLLRRNR